MFQFSTLLLTNLVSYYNYIPTYVFFEAGHYLNLQVYKLQIASLRDAPMQPRRSSDKLIPNLQSHYFIAHVICWSFSLIHFITSFYSINSVILLEFDFLICLSSINFGVDSSLPEIPFFCLNRPPCTCKNKYNCTSFWFDIENMY